MHPSELNDSVLNAMLVGVATSVEDGTDDSNSGTDVNGWSGDSGGAEVRGDGDAGIVLIRSSDVARTTWVIWEVPRHYGSPLMNLNWQWHIQNQCQG